MFGGERQNPDGHAETQEGERRKKEEYARKHADEDHGGSHAKSFFTGPIQMSWGKTIRYAYQHAVLMYQSGTCNVLSMKGKVRERDKGPGRLRVFLRVCRLSKASRRGDIT